MAIKIYIFGEAPMVPENLLHLHRDLNDFLKTEGDVICDSDEHIGPCWNIDILLHDDAELETWIQRLAAFFEQRGVWDSTLSFTIIKNVSLNGSLTGKSEWEHRQIVFAPRYFSQSF